MQKPRPITTEDFIRSVTMFYIDAELEAEFLRAVATDVQALQSRLSGVGTIEGLRQYIRDDHESLNRLTSLLSISEERFKRVITMLRLEKRHMPTGEWTLSTVRSKMIESPSFMDEVCNLLTNGARSDKYKALIPSYYLENFIIDQSTIERLSRADDIRRLVKKGLEGNYNNRIGDSFFETVTDFITGICNEEGLPYVIKKHSPLVGRSLGLMVPDATNPRLLVNITYGITTSSAQTKYAETAEAIATRVRELNRGRDESAHLILVNVLDGAGWVARQSDLNKIQRCSTYMLNLRSLDMMREIIDYYF